MSFDLLLDELEEEGAILMNKATHDLLANVGFRGVEILLAKK